MTLRVLLYCLLGGLPLTIAALGTGPLAWWWLSGILLATSFVPIALYGPRGGLRQLGVIAPALLVVTVLCTWSPNEFMGTAQRMIHIVEILTQNALLGITAVLLLRPRSAPVAAAIRAA